MTVARRAQKFVQELVIQPFDHALASATFADKLFTAQKKMRVDKVEYINPTGYVEDAANYYVIGLKKGATVMYQWSCETGEEGTIAADTFVDMTASTTDTDLVADADDEIIFFGTKVNAGVDLPAGRLVIHGRYL